MPAEVEALRGEIRSLSRRLEARLALAGSEANLQIAIANTQILKSLIWAAIVGQAVLILAVGALLQQL